MAGNRDEILKSLREYVIEVHFDKVNGEHRAMRCTLRPDLLPPSYREKISEQKEEENFHQTNPDVVAAWDIQKGGWRSFRVENVKYVQNVNDNY
jgi:hypothetical protein